MLLGILLQEQGLPTVNPLLSALSSSSSMSAPTSPCSFTIVAEIYFFAIFFPPLSMDVINDNTNSKSNDMFTRTIYTFTKLKQER